MKRQLLGSFEVPSGGEVDIYIGQAAGGCWELFFEWPNFPPSEEDVCYYRRHLTPILAKRVKEKIGINEGDVLWLM